jgi:monoamine oxidase
VTVTTSRGIYFADHAIVTLPLGVLQSGHIRFAEPLDTRRARAIDRLGVGLLNKCVLRFDHSFWPADKDWIDFLGPTENLWADWTNYRPATGQPLIVGFNAARMADEVEGWSDRDTTASALAALRAMFGSAVPDPIGAQISRWRQDPCALGAYSFKAVGSNRKDRKALFGADWDARLFFAGEATSADQPSTVHGALMTGRLAASAVLAGKNVG